MKKKKKNCPLFYRLQESSPSSAHELGLCAALHRTVVPWHGTQTIYTVQWSAPLSLTHTHTTNTHTHNKTYCICVYELTQYTRVLLIGLVDMAAWWWRLVHVGLFFFPSVFMKCINYRTYNIRFVPRHIITPISVTLHASKMFTCFILDKNAPRTVVEYYIGNYAPPPMSSKRILFVQRFRSRSNPNMIILFIFYFFHSYFHIYTRVKYNIHMTLLYCCPICVRFRGKTFHESSLHNTS